MERSKSTSGSNRCQSQLFFLELENSSIVFDQFGFAPTEKIRKEKFEAIRKLKSQHKNSRANRPRETLNHTRNAKRNPKERKSHLEKNQDWTWSHLSQFSRVRLWKKPRFKQLLSSETVGMPLWRDGRTFFPRRQFELTMSPAIWWSGFESSPGAVKLPSFHLWLAAFDRIFVERKKNRSRKGLQINGTPNGRRRRKEAIRQERRR